MKYVLHEIMIKGIQLLDEIGEVKNVAIDAQKDVIAFNVNISINEAVSLIFYYKLCRAEIYIDKNHWVPLQTLAKIMDHLLKVEEELARTAMSIRKQRGKDWLCLLDLA